MVVQDFAFSSLLISNFVYDVMPLSATANEGPSTACRPTMDVLFLNTLTYAYFNAIYFSKVFGTVNKIYVDNRSIGMFQ